MATAVSGSPPPTDTSAPSTPSGLSASTLGSGRWRSPGLRRATMWGFRATTCIGRRQPASRPMLANRIAQPTGTSYTDSGLAAGTYHYRVTAEDAAGNISGPAAPQPRRRASRRPARRFGDPRAAAGATVSGTVALTAAATDNVGVAGVQFRLRRHQPRLRGHVGALFHSWTTTTVANGTHSLTAVARDTAAHRPPRPRHRDREQCAAEPRSRRGAYGFKRPAAPTAADCSASGNRDPVAGPTRYAGAASALRCASTGSTTGDGPRRELARPDARA